ncbi:MAG: vanadium-dependent haloperoxidase [Janthinobacterium lividum]
MRPLLAAVLALGVAAGVLGVSSAQAQPTPVTTWTDKADQLGNGNANWHSLAIMHMAMHDALNAVRPIYVRWAPPRPDEPPAAGAAPQAALEAAAATVLEGLHPDRRRDIAALLEVRMTEVPRGPTRDEGLALGRAIGAATLARRSNDGFNQVLLFPGSDVPGVWRPTPPRHQSSATTRTQPFLFAGRSTLMGVPPPEPGSPRYRADVDAVRRIGGAVSTERTPEQTAAAIFWAYQSTQRGYVQLAATLIDADPERFDLSDQARIMSQMTAAMADAAILIWEAKERWLYWRPVDAIQSGTFNVAADPSWQSFIETPPHPEYPSGHAADCYTGAALLQATLRLAGPLTYTAQSAPSVAVRPAEIWSSDMGMPPAPVELTPTPRRFATLQEAARQCADARIWAGAHFPSANEESRRIAALIVARATAALPPLPR